MAVIVPDRDAPGVVMETDRTAEFYIIRWASITDPGILGEFNVVPCGEVALAERGTYDSTPEMLADLTRLWDSTDPPARDAAFLAAADPFIPLRGGEHGPGACSGQCLACRLAEYREYLTVFDALAAEEVWWNALDGPDLRFGLAMDPQGAATEEYEHLAASMATVILRGRTAVAQ